ncbi:TetR/AcrR family transcriptional regulator [Frigidibacter oleivorans]|uniref:TetR/AcrR family transcriptional regulator n=1 Tax=Frigidibacter oleivorans TaxID=2487129 RepID=UPI000F8ECEDC|nr:TetR/AcrR family transcriptional regulator [Frigidibacter oleivorans]
MSKARPPTGSRRNPRVSEAILDAAREILTERGAAGFSMEAVAQRAGAGKPTIYRWWPTRADLLMDVYEREKLVSVVPAQSDDPNDDLLRYTVNLWQFWSTHTAGQAFRGLIAEAQSSPAAMTALRDRFLPPRLSTIREMLGRILSQASAEEIDLRARLWLGFSWQALLQDQILMEEVDIGRAIAIITCPSGA